MIRAVAPVLASLLVAAPSSGEDPLAELCARFAGFDQDGDGAAEIRALETIVRAGETGARLLVLVERRLLDPLDGAPPLAPLLERLARDLAAEGLRAEALAVELEPSALHQDGRYVLALRELLRAVAREGGGEGGLAGALFVGHFPDAFLVRTCNWRKQETVVLRDGQETRAEYPDAPYLRRVPEDIAHRAEIVLSDLDGRWEEVYVQPRTRLEAIHAVYPGGIPARGGPCADLERRSVIFEDFFHVSDGKCDVSERLDAADEVVGWSLALFDESGDHECSDADRARPNVMAQPDIVVARIDARGVALSPSRAIAGADGAGLLDADGQPQAVRFASESEVPDWRDAIWEDDPVLERRLLAEYLERNHAFRTRSAPVAWRSASIACGLGSGFGVMQRAAGDWQESDPALADVHGGPTLARVAEWLRYPAVLRTVRAHSDPWGCVFGRGELAQLASALGGPAWSWTPRGERLEPSLAAACGGGKLDWYLLRTLWANGAVAPEPAFYHHTGCHGITPAGAQGLPYGDPAYGRRQGAESLLFLANGLALVGRAKVFYDEPRGFAQALGEGLTFGAAWARYFELESQGPSWNDVGGDIGRKRAYFWSVLGDWTLKLSHASPQ